MREVERFSKKREGGILRSCGLALKWITSLLSVSDDICGIPSNQPRFIFSRIIGGEEAVPYSWPWQVSVQISDEHVCGGAVLAREWVVTAAHFLLNNKIEINFKRSVKQYIIHPSFNKTTMDSDIALLQLAEPLEFNPYVGPVCLPAKEEAVQPSRVCVVTGWGAHEAVPILVLDTCQSYYINLPSKVTQRMICAGFPLEEGKDSCTGDSGGPLVCPSEDNSGFYTLHGITSWGLGCGEKSYPGVYTNVGVFVDWIKHITSENLISSKCIIIPFFIAFLVLMNVFLTAALLLCFSGLGGGREV
uniref:Peptidase S1 domain-containing protein n=1 Tax=Bubo bubo TaxID=30461 RepID=A0A8C0FV96_BUBBB